MDFSATIAQIDGGRVLASAAGLLFSGVGADPPVPPWQGGTVLGVRCFLPPLTRGGPGRGLGGPGRGLAADGDGGDFAPVADLCVLETVDGLVFPVDGGGGERGGVGDAGRVGDGEEAKAALVVAVHPDFEGVGVALGPLDDGAGRRGW